MSFWQPTADNTYRALLLKVEKRMTHNYQYLVSYTFSKAKDNAFTNVLGDQYGWVKLDRSGDRRSCASSRGQRHSSSCRGPRRSR